MVEDEISGGSELRVADVSKMPPVCTELDTLSAEVGLIDVTTVCPAAFRVVTILTPLLIEDIALKPSVVSGRADTDGAVAPEDSEALDEYCTDVSVAVLDGTDEGYRGVGELTFVPQSATEIPAV